MLGRDPIAEPLTQREFAYFHAALTEHLREEYPDPDNSPADGEEHHDG